MICHDVEKLFERGSFCLGRHKAKFLFNNHDGISCNLQQKSAFKTARVIFREHGFGDKGLNKALTSTLMRHGVFNMIYFSFYHNVKSWIPQMEVSKISGRLYAATRILIRIPGMFP